METTNEEEPINPEKLEKKNGEKKIKLARNRTAFERLQLAWIRASLTLLTIGVGAYEYFYNRREEGKAPLMQFISGRELGLFLIFTSFVMLLLATLQHLESISTLKKYYPDMQYSVATILSFLLLALSFSLGTMLLFKF